MNKELNSVLKFSIALTRGTISLQHLILSAFLGQCKNSNPNLPGAILFAKRSRTKCVRGLSLQSRAGPEGAS